MHNQGLENYFKRTDNASSYFDFVEKKIAEDLPTRRDNSHHEDGFVVQVMDQEATDQLKLQYFNGYTFPK